MIDTKNFAIPDMVTVKRRHGVIIIGLRLLNSLKQGVYRGGVKGWRGGQGRK